MRLVFKTKLTQIIELHENILLEENVQVHHIGYLYWHVDYNVYNILHTTRPFK